MYDVALLLLLQIPRYVCTTGSRAVWHDTCNNFIWRVLFSWCGSLDMQHRAGAFISPKKSCGSASNCVFGDWEGLFLHVRMVFLSQWCFFFSSSTKCVRRKVPCNVFWYTLLSHYRSPVKYHITCVIETIRRDDDGSNAVIIHLGWQFFIMHSCTTRYRPGALF